MKEGKPGSMGARRSRTHRIRRGVGLLVRTGLLRLRPGVPKLPRSHTWNPGPLPRVPLGPRGGREPESWLGVPGTDCSWPLVHHRYISYRDACGDLRSLWEASRFRWVRPENFLGVFGSWVRANPPGLGPNWASGLEVAARAVNWIFLFDGIRQKAPGPQRDLVLRWLLAHGRHLAENPEHHPPNHALGWALGLFALGGYLRGLPGAEAWFRRGEKATRDAIARQFLEDGSCAEGALGYGAFATEMGLLFLGLARAWGLEPGVEPPEVLQRSLDFLANTAGPGRALPILGDFDNGGFLRPRERPVMDYLNELAGAGGLSPGRARGTSFYRAGGFLVMAGGQAHLVARVDDPPELPGGHRHSDMGSFVLWLGEPVVVDPGVYLYTGPGALREELRSETAHNTLWLETRPMHLRDPQRPFTLEGRKNALFSGWEGRVFVLRHDLFGPTLERRFVLEGGGVRIQDAVSEAGPWRAGFTLGPDLRPEHTQRGILLWGKRGLYRVELLKGTGRWEIAGGIFCPAYGIKRATKRLVFTPSTRGWEISIRKIPGPGGSGAARLRLDEKPSTDP